MDSAFYLSLSMMVFGYFLSLYAGSRISNPRVYKLVDTLAAGVFITGLCILLIVAFFFGILKGL